MTTQEKRTVWNPEATVDAGLDPDHQWSITYLGLDIISAYVTPGIYRHYKGGLYQVLGVVYMDGTRKPYVEYRPIYDLHGYPFGQKTIRDFEEFIGWLVPESLHDVHDDTPLDRDRVKRFTRIASAPWRE